MGSPLFQGNQGPNLYLKTLFELTTPVIKCLCSPRQVSRVVESGSGFSSSSRSKGVMVKRGEEGEEREVTEKREEERDVGRGLVKEERVDWVGGGGGRNWGRTKEGGMCNCGRPATNISESLIFFARST